MKLLNEKQSALLLFIGSDDREVDPVRIMKGLFLFTQKAPEEWAYAKEKYEFVPYSYGPCSFEVYNDLDTLESRGLIKSRRIPGQTWKYYKLSHRGQQKFDEIYKRRTEETNYLALIKEFVLKLSFRTLLKTIYRHYPEYAEKSVFK